MLVVYTCQSLERVKVCEGAIVLVTFTLVVVFCVRVNVCEAGIPDSVTLADDMVNVCERGIAEVELVAWLEECPPRVNN